MALSVQDFSAKIKAKYPQYKDIPDDQLAQKIVDKHPVYKDQVDFGPPKPQPTFLQRGGGLEKMANLANATVGRAANALFGTTAKAAGSVIGAGAESAYELATGKPSQRRFTSEANELLGTPEKAAGTVLGVAGETLPFMGGGALKAIPGVARAGEAISGLTKAIPGVARAGEALGGIAEKVGSKIPQFVKGLAPAAKSGAAYGGLFGASGALQKEKGFGETIGETAKGAAVGAALGAGLPAVTEGAARAFKNVASIFSGVPREAIQRAFENPEAVATAVKEYHGEEGANKLLNKVKVAIGKLKKTRGDQYEAALKGVEDKVLTKNGQVFIQDQSGNFVKSDLSLDGVKQTIDKTLSDFKINKTPEGEYDFKKSPLTKDQTNKIKEMVDRVNTWDDVTPTGLNDLRQIIDSYKSHMEGGRYNAIVGKVRTDLVSHINEKVPEIGEMNSGYAQASDFLDEIKKELGSDKVKDQTKINKILNVFKPNSQERQRIIDELGQKTGSDLLNEIAGVAMTDWLPRGIAGKLLGGIEVAGQALMGTAAAHPAGLIPLGLSSPRLVGTAARVAGRLKPAFQPVTKFATRQINKEINQ